MQVDNRQIPYLCAALPVSSSGGTGRVSETTGRDTPRVNIPLLKQKKKKENKPAWDFNYIQTV